MWDACAQYLHSVVKASVLCLTFQKAGATTPLFKMNYVVIPELKDISAHQRIYKCANLMEKHMHAHSHIRKYSALPVLTDIELVKFKQHQQSMDKC